MNLTNIIVIIIFAVNITGFITAAIDKYKARHKMWRIPESFLFFLGIIGGCPGLYLGFLSFRHKTRHLKFMLGIPVIFLIQLLVLYSIIPHFLSR